MRTTSRYSSAVASMTCPIASLSPSVALDVARDRLELLDLRPHVEAELDVRVVRRVDLRQLALPGPEKLLLDGVVPPQRLQHADRLLPFDDPIGELGDDLLVALPGARDGGRRRSRGLLDLFCSTLGHGTRRSA